MDKCIPYYPTDRNRVKEISAGDEVGQFRPGPPHVVIIGAGASRAAFPQGERSGKQLPLMNDFTKIVPVAPGFHRLGIPLEGRNFEDLYSQLYNDVRLTSARVELESTMQPAPADERAAGQRP